jgi:hypothetical protein
MLLLSSLFDATLQLLLSTLIDAALPLSSLRCLMQPCRCCLPTLFAATLLL